MNKVLLVGDSHLKVSRLDEARQFIAELLGHLKGEGDYKAVILLGDQFDSFAVVRSEILSLWTQFFTEASKISHVVVIVGNHDLSGAEGGNHPFEPFENYPNVTIVDQPKSLSIGQAEVVHFLPFIRDQKQFEAACLSLPKGQALFCHQSFNGAQFENGFYDPHGASAESVSHLAYVVSGHIHKRQKISNIWYPGTPFQHSFSDAGEKKHVFALDLGTSHYNILREIDLKMPSFHVAEASCVADLLPIVDNILGATPENQLRKTHLKLVAPGTPSDIQAFWQEESVKRLKKLTLRLVDGFTSVRPLEKRITIRGNSQKERLDEFIQARSWRTNSERLAARAQELLSD